MGLLVNGRWVDKGYDTKKTGGKFVREASQCRDFIGNVNFPVENERYHLYISYACPWAHRANIFRTLKNLEEIISITVVNSYMGEKGWSLSEDPINGKKYLYEIYTLAKPHYTGRVTVPILWDKKNKAIVNNESAEIIRIFNSAFNQLTNNQADYYPDSLQDEIDDINSYVYDNVNNSVYKVGFATEQNVYESEVKKLFTALDTLENRLSNQRYLVGNTLTEADWRFFTTLIRFDLVYVGHFKCNLKRIADYPNLSNYIKDLYQIKGIKETVNFQHIKEHYYFSHATINPNRIIPVGPILDYQSTHDRNKFCTY